uniref:Uncharacterized protein n=1 Tax=Solanum tuberosum TaxID=4113 RepID=M0ZJF2_SOLTU
MLSETTSTTASNDDKSSSNVHILTNDHLMYFRSSNEGTQNRRPSVRSLHVAHPGQWNRSGASFFLFLFRNGAKISEKGVFPKMVKEF